MHTLQVIATAALLSASLFSCGDDQQATLTLDVPAGILTGTTTITVTGTADEFVILIDDSIVSQSTISPLAIEWDTSIYADGDHLVTAQGYNSGSAQPDVVTRSVTTQNSITTSETGTITTSTTGSTETGTTTTETGTATTTTETGSPTEPCSITSPAEHDTIWEVYPFKVAGAGLEKVDYTDGTNTFEKTESPWIWDWDSTSVAPASGYSNVQLNAVATIDTGDICDKTLPVYVILGDVLMSEFIAPQSASCVSGVVDAEFVFGGGEGRDRIELFIDGVYEQKRESYPWEIKWDSTAFTDGIHEISSVGYEKNTGATVEQVIEICIDNATGCTTVPKECSKL
jgi:hypothetical protein